MISIGNVLVLKIHTCSKKFASILQCLLSFPDDKNYKSLLLTQKEYGIKIQPLVSQQYGNKIVSKIVAAQPTGTRLTEIFSNNFYHMNQMFVICYRSKVCYRSNVC